MFNHVCTASIYIQYEITHLHIHTIIHIGKCIYSDVSTLHFCTIHTRPLDLLALNQLMAVKNLLVPSRYAVCALLDACKHYRV